MSENYYKKNANKFTHKCMSLLNDFNILFREADNATVNRQNGEKNMLDHELLDFMPDNFWVSQMNLIKKNVDNIVIGLDNVYEEVVKLSDDADEYSLDDKNFPILKFYFTNLKDQVKQAKTLVREKSKILNKFTKIYQMFNSDVDIFVIRDCIENLKNKVEKLVKNVNAYSISLKNKDIYEQKRDETERDAQIHLYVLSFHNYFCEKNIFERFLGKEKIEQKLLEGRLFFDSILENKIDEADKIILSQFIKNPSKEAVKYFTENFEKYVQLLCLSSVGQTFNRTKQVKLSRKEIENLATLLKRIEEARTTSKNDLYTNRRRELFENVTLKELGEE